MVKMSKTRQTIRRRRRRRRVRVMKESKRTLDTEKKPAVP